MNKSPGIEKFAGISGSDGYIPIYQPDARWAIWSFFDIYMGKEGLNKYVPKVGDWVVYPQDGVIKIVVKLDQITFIPEFDDVDIARTDSTDKLVSYSDQNWVLNYDTSQNPPVLTPDISIHCFTDEARYYRLYRGIYIDPAKIISRLYNNSGDFVSLDIPVAVPKWNTKYGDKAPLGFPSCNTNTELKDGEVCLLVAFGSEGRVLTKHTLLVNEATFVPPALSETRIISNIYLKSIFIQESEPNIINFPINLTTESFQPIGVVQYTNGTTEEYIVDGSKFELKGLSSMTQRQGKGPIINSFASTTVGMEVPLVLSYNKERDVGTIMDTGVDPNVISVPYSLVVDHPKRSYGVKLYAYPTWIDEDTGYRIRYYLMNLDRDLFIDVTPYVSLAVNSDAFDGKAYGYSQNLTVMLNLAEVSETYGYFIHSQTLQIVLRARANDGLNENIWEVATQYPTNVPYYGTGLRAYMIGNKNNGVNIKNNFKNVEEFLDNTYYRLGPLRDPVSELKPVEPTHLLVTWEGETVVVKVQDYDKNIMFKNPVRYFANINIIYAKQLEGKFAYLATSEITIRN